MASFVQVLGPGCAKCQALYDRVNQAVGEAGLACRVEKVTDVEVIVGLGILSTPALVVDGKVKVSGNQRRTDFGLS